MANDLNPATSPSSNQKESSDWPNPTPLITSIAGACFVASVLYIHGLDTGLNQNLFGYFDLTDFLRITPRWAVPALGGFLLGEWNFLIRGVRPEDVFTLKPAEPKSKFWRIVRFLIDPDWGLFILAVVLQAIATIWSIHRRSIFTDLVLLFAPTFIAWRLALDLVKRIKKKAPDAKFLFEIIPLSAVPPLAFMLTYSFFWGQVGIRSQLRNAPEDTITLKETGQTLKGKVFLELDHFILYLAEDKSVVAVDASSIRSIQMQGTQRRPEVPSSHADRKPKVQPSS